MEQKHDKSDRLLNYHVILPVSCANGPGARAVIWVQGCSKRCPGCSNPSTHSHEPRILVEPQQLVDSILTIPDIEGITVTGGEPFEQPVAVGYLCQAVRKGGLSVMVFTGWTYEDICQSGNQAVRDLLNQIDILVDGSFVQELAGKKLLWRGSSNQQIRFLTDRYIPDTLQTDNPPRVEALLASGSSVQITGFPNESDIQVLTEHLAAEAGILLEPADPECNENPIIKSERLL